MTPTQYQGISFNADTNTYYVDTTALTANINTIIKTASAGATVLFSAGIHTLTSTLQVQRDNITIKGEGKDLTHFSLDFGGKVQTGINVKGGIDTSYSNKLAIDVTVGSKIITVQDATGLKAGDVLRIEQANDEAFLSSGLYDNVRNSPYMATEPLRQAIVEIESITGNQLILKHAIAYDMAGGQATVQRLNMLDNIVLEGFTVTPKLNLPPPDPNLFENPLPEWQSTEVMKVQYTKGVQISDIEIVNAASHSLEIRTALEPHVDGFTANGAYNKGDGNNGYGLHIAETFYGDFQNITAVDTRHAVVFSSWSAEAYNTIEVDFTNRDINYHGSPDHSNTVIVNEVVYEGSAEENWALVSPGSTMHPYTDISQNTTLFKYAEGGIKADTVTGWDGGAVLYGNGGDDKLTGGAGADLINGGIGNDILTGGAGSDTFEHASEDGNDTLTDFQTGQGGDILALTGYSGLLGLQDLYMSQIGTDVKITLRAYLSYSDTITIKNTSLPSLSPDNIRITAPVQTPYSLTLSSLSDYIVTGEGNDVVTAYYSNLTALDTVRLGAGTDTLKIISNGFTMTPSSMTGISGIEIFDFTASPGEKITLDDRTVAQSDTGHLTLRYGSGSITRLDTSTVTADHNVILEGTGAVQLANVNNRVVISDKGSGVIAGGTANDIIIGGSSNDIMLGGAGIDDLNGGNGDDQMSGGTGRDTFRIYLGQGKDIITDFQAGAGGDILILQGFYQFHGLNDLNLEQIGTNVFLRLDGADSLLFNNTTVQSFTLDNFIFESLISDMATGTDHLVTTSGNDTITASSRALNFGDVIDMGLGIDTLKLIGGNWTLDTQKFTAKGIDILDLTDALGPVRLTIGSGIVLGSDSSKLTVISGTDGISWLDVGQVPTDKTISLKGTGQITLADNAANAVTVESGSGLFIQGAGGIDTIRLRGGEVSADGGLGNDIFSVSGAGHYSFAGGDGNDFFGFSRGEFISGTTISGGAGIDEIRLYTGFTLTETNLAGLSGIDQFTLYGEENFFSAIGTIFDTRIEFKGVGTSRKLNLDISNISDSQTVAFSENLKVYLSGEDGDSYRIETTGKFNGELHGSTGNERMTGGIGMDRFYGNDGDDWLYGMNGNDTLNGGNGDDVLAGGLGNDLLTGGLGNDRFVISNRSEGADIITDFNVLENDNDILDLTALFLSNNLGAMDTATALKLGYLTLNEQAGQTVIGFDRDGSGKSLYTTASIVTLLDTTPNELSPANIITALGAG